MKTATPTAQPAATRVISHVDDPDVRAGSVETAPVGPAGPPADAIVLPGGGRLECRRLPGVVEVRIVGEVDMFDRASFSAAFAALESEPAPFLYVLAETAAFIESSCLDAIAQTAVARERAGGSTVVCGLREPFATAWSLSTPGRADCPPGAAVGR